MTIQVALEHRTRYRFDRPVTLGPHLVRLRPAPHCRTPILSYSLTVGPGECFLNWQQDPFGNHVAHIVFPELVTELDIAVDLVAELGAINPFDFFVEDYAGRYPFDYEPGLAADLEPYRRRVPGPDRDGPGPLLSSWLERIGPPPAGGRPIVDFLVELNQQVASDVAYTVRLEHGVQSPEETLARQIGSCRDSGWLLVAALRELGLAARFVSGYLVQLRPDQMPGLPQEGPAEDFTDLHAWAEVFIPGAGWLGLDATSGLFAGEGHIPLSATPHPTHSAPVTGTAGPSQTVLEFSNSVRRLREPPRVTAPYREEEWSRIQALGADVDRALVAGDVRLTMGGEPTFVAADDMESEQWRIAADGPDKRRLAATLAERLREHYSPRGLVHHGLGKWYPGEDSPRWQIALTWRVDGEPVWAEPRLLDDPWGKPVVEPDSPAADARAGELAVAIARELGIDADLLLPAYDDVLHRLWEEARAPAGDPPARDLDPLDSSLADAASRARLSARFDAEAGRVAGWVLPLFRTEDGTAWATTRWRTRRSHLFLLSGTLPIGLRLPLDSLGWEPPPVRPERSPFAAAHPLPAATGTGPLPPAVVEPLEVAPRTALCVEEREGHLFVFLPPTEELADGLELVAAVERAAGATGLAVVVEGYPLPADARVRTLTVTPDPGVIEVNVQPTDSWDALTELTETLAVLGRRSGLATEKFDLDGRHTGTGGGSHITLGGVTPADSPLLRRPDLLVSMLTFWQHHPSLSYLFSGSFIGPTSQAPRVDEARHESLYELEIAFAELAKASDEARPWQIDRALRHLLTDSTGNTHRAEFCIDKLFSPDSERGRLGVLELRGFEMPPHPRMALVQALLVRALVARFWQSPYSGPLVRWGTQLHDQYVLPFYLAADVAEVAQDLQAHGIPFDAAWLDPFLEFRFPRLGEVEVAGVSLELRSSIEPWHVLGEEAAAGGTSRYVDSSVERLQVMATGLTGTRHVVTCNGVPVPLRSTGTPGTWVGGVRYRAWQPWSALHPSIGVHAPLVFDLVDRWNARSLGGCTYHVVHPGGRSYDRFPVNAGEAEARRSGRFTTLGHTPGSIDLASLPSPAISPDEYPHTLDLRTMG